MTFQVFVPLAKKVQKFVLTFPLCGRQQEITLEQVHSGYTYSAVHKKMGFVPA